MRFTLVRSMQRDGPRGRAQGMVALVDRIEALRACQVETTPRVDADEVER